jgi:GDPmannose 4,6-dehydratase
MFGVSDGVPLTIKSKFNPHSPYALHKSIAHNLILEYREKFALHLSTGILFNHESPRRGETFVTRKITRAFRKIVNDEQDFLYLGNLNAKRDWGHAKDFVEAMWLMLQQDKPEDYVIATGEQYSVREFVEKVAAHHGIDLAWRGEGLDEVGYDKNTGDVYVKVDPKYFRPAEVETLLGDSTKARIELGWNPRHTFEQLVEDMCNQERG